MDDDYVPVKHFKFTFPSSIITPPPKEDDSRLDKEIEQEEDAHMKMQSQSQLPVFIPYLAAALKDSPINQRGKGLTTAMRPQQSQLADLGAAFDCSNRGKGWTTSMRPQQSQFADLAARIQDSFLISQRGMDTFKHVSLPPGWLAPPDPNYVRVPVFKDASLPPSWITPPRPKEDDSWLDKEIEEEENAFMKEMLIVVKRTMKRLSNEAKRNFIFEERMRIVERKQYAKEMDSTQGFEVGEYPCLTRVGNIITRYYCPPETTITDYELDKLTSFANLAIARYNNITHIPEFSNVLVIKAMRCFSGGGGHCYYLTFQASLPDHPPQVFEAQLYDAPHWVSPPVTIDFVRPKMHQPN